MRELLKGLDSHLAEEELLAVCRECTKTLRTLDALGSLRKLFNVSVVSTGNWLSRKSLP